MKKIIIIGIIIGCIFLTSRCRKKEAYAFQQDEAQISTIELVNIDTDDIYLLENIHVLKTLSAEETEEFLKNFYKIDFGNYVYGDPIEPWGECFKVNYRDGNYEIITFFFNKYIHEGKTVYLFKYCDEEDFRELWDLFAD